MDKPYKTDEEIEVDLRELHVRIEQDLISKSELHILINYYQQLRKEHETLRRHLITMMGQFQEHVKQDKERKIRDMREKSLTIAKETRKIFGIPDNKPVDMSALKSLSGLLREYADDEEDAERLVRSIREDE